MAEEEKADPYLSHLQIFSSSIESPLKFPLKFNPKVINGLGPRGAFVYYL